jgi:hypothetical protein
MEFWRIQTRAIMKTPSFESLNRETLKELISQDSLNVDELELFQACVRWSKTLYRQNHHGRESSARNVRKYLGDILYLIRFPTMDVKDFAKDPATSGILSDDECNRLFRYIILANESPSKKFSFASFFSSPSSESQSLSDFSLTLSSSDSSSDNDETASPVERRQFLDNPRRIFTTFRCERFLTTGSRLNQWKYHGRPDCISFHTDRHVFLLGCSLYGSSANPNNGYEACVWLKEDKTILLEERTTYFTCKSPLKIQPIYFNNPIELNPDTLYTAGVTMRGNDPSFFGIQGKKSVKLQTPNGPMTVNFFCDPCSTNGTGVYSGQIPDLIFSLPFKNTC